MAEIKERPKILNSESVKEMTGCGSIYVKVSFMDGEVVEVFATRGKAGGCSNAQLEALCRSISLGLRAGIPLAKYYKHLKDIKCGNPTFSEGNMINSCADAIARVIKGYLPEDK